MPASTASSIAASSGALAAGIFATEVGQRLLFILQELTRFGFEGLYRRCKDSVQGEYYQMGLRRVHLWRDETLQDDLRRVRQRCPDLDETYEEAFVQYVADRYRGRRRPTVRCPPLLEFTRRFLESVGQHDALVSGQYFAAGDVLTVRVACMDAARQALYALLTAETVRVELESEAGTAVAPPPAAATRDLRDATAADVRRVEGQHAAAPSEVMPADSISQVSCAPPPASDAGARREREREREREYAPPPPASDVGAREREYAPPPPPASDVPRRASASTRSPPPAPPASGCRRARARVRAAAAAGERRRRARARVRATAAGAAAHAAARALRARTTAQLPGASIAASPHSSVRIGMSRAGSPRPQR